jgi:hypothetical protein
MLRAVFMPHCGNRASARRLTKHEQAVIFLLHFNRLLVSPKVNNPLGFFV